MTEHNISIGLIPVATLILMYTCTQSPWWLYLLLLVSSIGYSRRG